MPFAMADYEQLAFSFKNTKRLITMVQNRPCLWDRQSADYKDRLARDRAWNEIFTEMDPAFKEGTATQRHEIGLSITKKWYNIRDSYAKSLKPDYFGRRNRPYVHAKLLGFLDECYLNKSSSGFPDQYRPPGEGPEETETEEPEAESWEHKVFVSLDEEEPSAKKRRPNSPEQSFNGSTKVKDEEDIISVLSNLIQKEEDEDRAFFKSITPSVKTLSEDSKLTFRIEVLNLVKKLKAKDKIRARSDSKDEEPAVSNNDSESD